MKQPSNFTVQKLVLNYSANQEISCWWNLKVCHCHHKCLPLYFIACQL